MAKVKTSRSALQEILKAVPHILKLPTGTVWCDYDEEVDVLYVSFKRPPNATHSEMTDDGMIVHYRGDQMVGVTILEASTR
jgi:uncharacterized protein YuzE